MRHTRIRGAAAALLAVLATCSCSVPWHNSEVSGKVVYKPPLVLPIEFSLDSTGHLAVSLSSESLTTFLGTFSLEGEAGADFAPAKPGSVVVLITHQVDGRRQQDAYRIDGTTTLTTCLDGRFHAKVTERRVELSALGGVSTIRLLPGNAPPEACGTPVSGAAGGTVRQAGPIACPPNVAARLPGGEGNGAVLRDYYRTTRFYLYICRSPSGRSWYEGITQFRASHWLVAEAHSIDHGYRMTLTNTTIVIDDTALTLDIRVGSDTSGDSILEFAHFPR